MMSVTGIYGAYCCYTVGSEGAVSLVSSCLRHVFLSADELLRFGRLAVECYVRCWNIGQYYHRHWRRRWCWWCWWCCWLWYHRYHRHHQHVNIIIIIIMGSATIYLHNAARIHWARRLNFGLQIPVLLRHHRQCGNGEVSAFPIWLLNSETICWIW